jgi:hypothetical protein
VRAAVLRLRRSLASASWSAVKRRLNAILQHPESAMAFVLGVPRAILWRASSTRAALSLFSDSAVSANVPEYAVSLQSVHDNSAGAMVEMRAGSHLLDLRGPSEVEAGVETGSGAFFLPIRYSVDANDVPVCSTKHHLSRQRSTLLDCPLGSVRPMSIGWAPAGRRGRGGVARDRSAVLLQRCRNIPGMRNCRSTEYSHSRA